MAKLSLNVYAASGNRRTIEWVSDEDGILMQEHFGLTSASTSPLCVYAKGGITPIAVVATNTPNGSAFIANPRIAMGSTSAQFSNRSTPFNDNPSCQLHWYGVWIKSGGPFVANNGVEELTVGSNVDGYYAEFRKESDLKRVLTCGTNPGSNVQSPLATQDTPVSMIVPDFPVFGNVYTLPEQKHVNLNAINANTFELITVDGAVPVTRPFNWVAEYIKGS